MRQLTLIIPAKNEPESLPSVLSELEKFDCNKTIVIDPSYDDSDDFELQGDSIFDFTDSDPFSEGNL